MDTQQKRCPECFSRQHEKAKYCSECAYSFGSSEKSKINWARINRYRKSVLTATIVIPILAWLLLPAPYNPAYQIKLVFVTPTAICEDGIYSFSKSRSGTCSNHGGVKKWIKKN
jgi:hypothetical protein